MSLAVREAIERTQAILNELNYRKSRRKIFDYFPETGDLRRELYVKHMAFFAAGKTPGGAARTERAAICANRIGKTETMGGYEIVMHLTGEYPDWWPGYRFDKPVKVWACGDTTQTVRDILQTKLVGDAGVPEKEGTGLIPGANIITWTRKPGSVPNCIETVYVKSKFGTSTITFKSYEQGRKSFQGTAIDIIWCDEEPPQDVYTEILLRTMTTGGMTLLTFTPLSGLSEVVLSFLPGGKLPEEDEEEEGITEEVRRAREENKKAVILATWDDAPHLDAATREKFWAKIPPSQREARSKGKPQLGAGAIYPIAEDDVVVKDFVIPDHWPRCFMLDVGWNRTAALWGAWDREADILYIYAEYYRGEAEPTIHASAIRKRGEWIPGAIDPAARGRNQKDGQKLMEIYRDDEKLDIIEADNAVEAGIYDVWGRLSTGNLKVFKSCGNFFDEFRIYRRDEKGRIVKERDHLMDCMRYLVLNFKKVARVKPITINGSVMEKLKKLAANKQRTSMSA